MYIAAEPATDNFVAVLRGAQEDVIPGTALVVIIIVVIVVVIIGIIIVVTIIIVNKILILLHIILIISRLQWKLLTTFMWGLASFCPFSNIL